MDTRSKSEPARLQTFVAVNEPALESWLRAWMAGESFSERPSSRQSGERMKTERSLTTVGCGRLKRGDA